MARTGNLSINSENMMPIIKKWLYSDHDIFVREQVSNACDAITKLKKLEGIGEYERKTDAPYEVKVIVNPDEKTLKFIDNGIGMTEAEVEEYITQIAFSGASEFLEKYKGKTDNDQIIGHFGLGFYSAFMVADEVHIDTLSYQEGAKPVHWESDGAADYTIDEGTKDTIGTEITLFLNDQCYEFCNEFRVREVLKKYCSFMPSPIYLEDEGADAKKRAADEEKRLREEDEKKAKEAEEKGEPAPELHTPVVPQPVNEVHPLWTKRPSECKDEDYKSFYREVFNDYKEPLFWIHLNMDYPFNLRGILYFPKINAEYDVLESQIKLYNNQVFIADNIKEVIPEFLMTMKGVIDCPDLPLNVSRSALQNDGTVKKISEYITKKVADKLTGMCKTDRENYEKYWDDIGPFLKFGCLKDIKFSEKIMDCVLYKDLDGKYFTLPEYEDQKVKAAPEAAENEDTDAEETVSAEVVDENGDTVSEAAADENGETKKDIIFYVTDEVQQAQYISMFRKGGKDAVILTHNIDQPFIQAVEQKHENLEFARIDAEVAEDLKSGDEVSAEDAESLTATFRKCLGKDSLNIKVESMNDEDIAAFITLSEQDRRMQDMMKMYGMGNDPSMFGGQETLVLNAKHPLVRFVLEHKRAQAVTVICEQLYDLAMISHKPLSQEEMSKFVKRSNEIMMLLTK